jgi:hypothetical protein
MTKFRDINGYFFLSLQKKSMKNILPSFFLSLSFLFASITSVAQTPERLIAISNYYGSTNGWRVSDSSTYSYSGNRSRDSSWGFMFSLVSFDTNHYYQNNNGFVPNKMEIFTYGANNKKMTDTLYQWNSATSGYVAGEFYNYSYNAAGLPAKAEAKDRSYSFWGNAYRFTFGYDMAGNKAEQVREDWNSQTSAYDTFSANFWTYNAAHQMTSSSETDFVSGTTNYLGRSKSVYLYDTQGRIDSLYGYQTNGTPALQLSLKWKYIYDSTTGLLSTLTSYGPAGSSWVRAGRGVYTYDANGNNIQHIVEGADSLGNLYNIWRFQYTYDSYNMMTSSTVAGWDTSAGGSWVSSYGTQKVNYYYEPYNPSGIAEIKLADMRIYPVPAANMLWLDILWDKAQSATASICDASGRGYGEWPLAEASNFQGYIPVGTLPPGMYIMKVKGTYSLAEKTFTINR